MILYYFPIAQNTVNKTVSDFFQRFKCLYMICTYFTIFSIYWSDTSLGISMSVLMVIRFINKPNFSDQFKTIIKRYENLDIT